MPTYSDMFAEAHANAGLCSCGCWYHGGDCIYREPYVPEEEKIAGVLHATTPPFYAQYTSGGVFIHGHSYGFWDKLIVASSASAPDVYDDPFADE